MDARELAFAGVVRQAKLIRERQVSARELVSVYLERIERLNPKINAFRTVFAEEALAAAEKVDDGKNWRNDLPLLGVPIAIKDDTEIAQKVASHGSRGMYRPARDDSEVVRLLRLVSAIVIGQTNVPELEIWPFTASLANGVTRNPWDLAYTPGGQAEDQQLPWLPGSLVVQQDPMEWDRFVFQPPVAAWWASNRSVDGFRCHPIRKLGMALLSGGRSPEESLTPPCCLMSCQERRPAAR